MGDADQLARFGRGTPGQRQHIEQGPRAQQRVNPGLWHLAQHRNTLRGIFLGKDRNLGIGKETAIHKFLGDQWLGLGRGHSGDLQPSR